MKKSRFSENQIIAILKQADGGTPVPQLCLEHGISPAGLPTQVIHRKVTGRGSRRQLPFGYHFTIIDGFSW